MAFRFRVRVIRCGFPFLFALAVCGGSGFLFALAVCGGSGFLAARSAEAQEQTGTVRQPRAVESDSRESAPQDGSTSGADMDCRQLAAMLQQQKVLITRETGQLKREIAALRDDLSKPGLKEIVAGIGYIVGLTGIALYLQSRRTNRK